MLQVLIRPRFRALSYFRFILKAAHTRSPFLGQVEQNSDFWAAKDLFGGQGRRASSKATTICTHRSQFLKDFLDQPPSPLYTKKTKVQMASDGDYANFLDKANQDTGLSKSSAQTTSKPSTKSVDTDVPGPLQKIEQYYTSEADEPFEPVSLKWDGKNIPSEKDFSKLIGHKDEVTTLQVKTFDPSGQYKQVLEAVESVGDGQVRIFKVAHGRTRVEYYIVGLDEKEKRVVGMKAMAVET